MEIKSAGTQMQGPSILYATFLFLLSSAEMQAISEGKEKTYFNKTRKD